MSSRIVIQMTETQVEPNRWIPVTDRVVPKDSKGIMAKPGIKSCSTQTQGLFYPSAKSLSTKVLSEVHKQQNKSASLDRTKHLTEFSPGKGVCVCTCSIAVVSQTALGVNYCEVEDCRAHFKEPNLYVYFTVLSACRSVEDADRPCVFPPQGTLTVLTWFPGRDWSEGDWQSGSSVFYCSTTSTHMLSPFSWSLLKWKRKIWRRRKKKVILYNLTSHLLLKWVCAQTHNTHTWPAQVCHYVYYAGIIS